MTLRTLYLQRMLSVNGRNSLAGRQLFDHLKEISEECLLAHAVLKREDADRFRNGNIANDVISEDLVDQLDPNFIYLEGGLFLDGDLWRIAQPIAEHFVANGSVLVVADVDINQLHENKAQYREASTFLGARFDYGQSDRSSPVYGADQGSFWLNPRQIVCLPQKMVIAEWLRPVYEGVSELMVGLPVRLDFWQHVLASGNQGSTGTLQDDRWIDQFDCCPFASVHNYGHGYAVTIGGLVSSDTWVDRCGGNVRWVENIGSFLSRDAASDRKRTVSHFRSPHLLFLSHRSSDKVIVGDVAREIKRKGIAVWLDKDKLIPSDSLWGGISSGLEEMSHFVLFWSQACLSGAGVTREWQAAAAALMDRGIPIIIVRLDETPVPAVIGDLFRIEANGLSGAEISVALDDAVQRLTRRSSSSS
ncbi:hypothetical protein P3T27_005800 [Kitasatospora sp. MAA19]|uniref:toll/interleukin-1 receptor domain-containing protein n=1 Tax=unclassified Kitasatospora TaxID=2633591 RepID=UPI002474E8BC|nr:toll/interleukin-1 receptor domain-containing protein [Kitasatospora sp. MAA19]MDH6709054.1 hypothetical protein [Kitasatospora sp. MAA19]